MHKLKICAVFVTLICLSNTAFAQNIQIKVTRKQRLQLPEKILLMRVIM